MPKSVPLCLVRGCPEADDPDDFWSDPELLWSIPKRVFRVSARLIIKPEGFENGDPVFREVGSYIPEIENDPKRFRSNLELEDIKDGLFSDLTDGILREYLLNRFGPEEVRLSPERIHSYKWIDSWEEDKKGLYELVLYTGPAGIRATVISGGWWRFKVTCEDEGITIEDWLLKASYTA